MNNSNFKFDFNNSNFNTKVENGKPTNNIERPFFISPTNNNFHKFGVKVNNSNPSVKNDINCIQFSLNNKPEPLVNPFFNPFAQNNTGFKFDFNSKPEVKPVVNPFVKNNDTNNNIFKFDFNSKPESKPTVNPFIQNDTGFKFDFNSKPEVKPVVQNDTGFKFDFSSKPEIKPVFNPIVSNTFKVDLNSNPVVEKKTIETQVEENDFKKEDNDPYCINSLKQTLLQLQITELSQKLNNKVYINSDIKSDIKVNVTPFYRRSNNLFQVKPMAINFPQPEEIVNKSTPSFSLGLSSINKNTKKKSKLFSSATAAASVFEPIKIVCNNNSPKVNNPLIELYPSLQELKQMTTEELKTIKNFTIFHKQFGRIEFIGITDVSNVNIDEDVIFNQSSLELYPLQNIPQYGTKLNKPAIVTLYNCYSKSIKELILSDNEINQSLLKQLEYKYKLKLINICEDCDYMDFISYTLEGGIWKFQIDGIHI